MTIVGDIAASAREIVRQDPDADLRLGLGISAERALAACMANMHRATESAELRDCAQVMAIRIEKVGAFDGWQLTNRRRRRKAVA